MDLEIFDAHMHLWTPQTHPWVSKAAKEGGHPAGSFGKQTFVVESKGMGVPDRAPPYTAASVETYTLAEYNKDIAGYKVTQSVHVEAVWPGDPVGETR